MAQRQKQPLSEAKRNAEALFETKNVADIREVRGWHVFNCLALACQDRYSNPVQLWL